MPATVTTVPSSGLANLGSSDNFCLLVRWMFFFSFLRPIFRFFLPVPHPRLLPVRGPEGLVPRLPLARQALLQAPARRQVRRRKVQWNWHGRELFEPARISYFISSPLLFLKPCRQFLIILFQFHFNNPSQSDWYDILWHQRRFYFTCDSFWIYSFSEQTRN